MKANIKYSYVIEKIEPLENEQNELRRNLEKAEARMSRLGAELAEVDRKVAGLKQRFENLTKEAAELKIKLDKENETIEAAENLVSKLDGEHQRWNQQVKKECFYFCFVGTCMLTTITAFLQQTGSLKI